MRTFGHPECGSKLRILSLCLMLVAATAAQAGNSGRGAPVGKNNDGSNEPPTIAGSPASLAFVGQHYDFTPAASDPEGYPLKFFVTGRPDWASFDGKTGRLWGVPSATQAGIQYTVTIEAADRWNRTPLGPFTIEVLATELGGSSPAPNSPPVISGTPPTSVKGGTAYSFRPSATDPDNDVLGFAIRNKPSWATFSTASGTLSGTAPDSASGTFSNIEISVSDGSSTAALPAFSIEVMGSTNHPPAISGSPAAVATAGQPYAFTPAAQDPDGDPITFAIQGKPAWAAFNTSNGKMSGTPSSGDAGTYGNIVISASDGEASAALPAFSLTVQQISNGNVTLSWAPPTQNTDGSALTDLAGYRVEYGQQSGSLDQQIEMMNPGLTSAVIENLAQGTWYFAVRAINKVSIASDPSGLATKSIP